MNQKNSCCEECEDIESDGRWNKYVCSNPSCKCHTAKVEVGKQKIDGMSVEQYVDEVLMPSTPNTEALDLETVVRDITEIPYRSKSEVRRLMSSLLHQREQRAREEGYEEGYANGQKYPKFLEETAKQKGRNEAVDYIWSKELDWERRHFARENKESVSEFLASDIESARTGERGV